MSAADAAEKQRLRKELGKGAARGDSAALCSRVLAHPWFLAGDGVMGFMPMPSEPDITPILRAALDMGKRLALPRCHGGGIMEAFWVEDLDALVPGAFGILEPGPSLPPAPPEALDLILTPGLSFDRTGGRLGRGMGYYDRFLAICPGKALGICFEEALLPRVPMEAHDRYMDGVATDLELMTFDRTEEDEN